LNVEGLDCLSQNEHQRIAEALTKENETEMLRGSVKSDADGRKKCLKGLTVYAKAAADRLNPRALRAEIVFSLFYG
jgi:hypothetical protein